MLLELYPIVGSLREPLIIMEWMLIFLCYELGLLSLFKYLSSKKEMRRSNDLSFSLLAFGYGSQWIIYVYADFYVAGAEQRYEVLAFAYLVLISFVLAFVYVVEKDYILFKKYFFTIALAVLTLIYLVVMLWEVSYTQPLSFFYWPLFIAFFLLYTVKLFRKYMFEKRSLWHYLKFFSGFALLMIGYGLTHDFLVGLFGIQLRLFADILQLIAVALIYLIVTQLPPFIEFEWHEKIHSLFLMNNAGLCIYHKFFHEERDETYQTLVTGSINTVRLMLEKISDTRGLSVIKKGERITLIYPGEYISGVMFCEKNLNILRVLLKRLVGKIETIYAPIFQEWKGKLNVFEPIGALCEELFSRKV